MKYIDDIENNFIESYINYLGEVTEPDHVIINLDFRYTSKLLNIHEINGNEDIKKYNETIIEAAKYRIVNKIKDVAIRQILLENRGNECNYLGYTFVTSNLIPENVFICHPKNFINILSNISSETIYKIFTRNE